MRYVQQRVERSSPMSSVRIVQKRVQKAKRQQCSSYLVPIICL